MYKRNGDGGISSHDKLIIALTVVFGIIGISLGVSAIFLCARRRRRRGLFNRGLTPISDDEIATWKVSREDQRSMVYPARPSHGSKESTSSAKIIQYQVAAGGSRPSVDGPTMSPRSFTNHAFGIELPQVPESAVFARAPNARAGLTDETIPGADPFVTTLKKQPSRLQKSGLSTPIKGLGRTLSQTRGSRSYSQPERWHNHSTDSSPAESKDANGRRHSRMYSFPSVPPHYYAGQAKETCTELSPPPSRLRQDAGKVAT
ncbi:hypothetical protein GGR50DRAFT_696216 [Xylaria sp. CBS 124048]|nr:hypothetical protein GGR50DRAFT_696216 [Xylaria sp. CBS 124048]